eukprot:TRINITY_DN3720_c0_g2_i10.p1 TRINITY_DN3720_c0_g2~~TRINITY_DN3720_c0_g2_i10.p1  ORF type:complete len:191 (-),score=12.35 TRINITY_DN3720_c0_g2_i10:231-803(-)
MILILLLFLLALSSTANGLIVVTADNYTAIKSSGKHVFMMFYYEGCFECADVHSAFSLLPQIVEEQSLDVIVALVDIMVYYTPAFEFNIDFFPNLLLLTPTSTQYYCPITKNVNNMVNFLINYVPVINDSNAEAANKGIEIVAEEEVSQDLKEGYDTIREYRKYIIGLVILLVWAFLFIICSTINRKTSI